MRAEEESHEDRSTRNTMALERDSRHTADGWRETARTGCASIAPKAAVVLAGVGLYVLVTDALSIVDALLGPLHFDPPNLSVIDVVMYVAGGLRTALAGFFITPMFAGWLSGRRGWLYGLVTALCLSFPESALALRSLALVPLDSLGDFGGLLAGWPWASLPLGPPAWCVPALCLLPSFAMLLVGAFGGFCGERLRLHGTKDGDT